MPTLNTFFNLQKESADWVNSITESQEFAQAKQIIAQDLKGFQASLPFYKQLITKLWDAMDIEMGKILVGGWRKYREIVKYRHKENLPSGYHEVTLLEHTFKSEHSPTIQPVVNEVPLAKLQFDITLKLKLEGVTLFIRDGKIMKAATGTCTGSGAIKYKVIKLLERKTDKVQLPGLIPFEPGITI
jgi:hypothetical protein